MMTIETLVIAPQYIGFYVAGTRKIKPPIDLDYGRIAANTECITVPSIYSYDGDTTVVVGPFAELNQTIPPDYSGVLNTPHRLIMLSEALADIADIKVSSTKTHVRIWVNHPTQPDHVVIGWSDPPE